MVCPIGWFEMWIGVYYSPFLHSGVICLLLYIVILVIARCRHVLILQFLYQSLNLSRAQRRQHVLDVVGGGNVARGRPGRSARLGTV